MRGSALELAPLADQPDALEAGRAGSRAPVPAELPVELKSSSHSALLADLDLFAEEFASWSVRAARSKARLRAVRAGLLRAARDLRAEQPEIWTEEAARKLQLALVTADKRASGQLAVLGDGPFSLVLEDLDIEDLAEAEVMQTTFQQQEVDTRECLRIIFGWVLIALVCYQPWITAALVGLKRAEEDQSCSKNERSFVYGLVFVLAINWFVNCVASCTQTVNHGTTFASHHADKVVKAVSFGVLVYNIYGLTVVWTPGGSPTDCILYPLILGVVITLLALPCLCFALDSCLKLL